MPADRSPAGGRAAQILTIMRAKDVIAHTYNQKDAPSVFLITSTSDRCVFLLPIDRRGRAAVNSKWYLHAQVIADYIASPYRIANCVYFSTRHDAIALVAERGEQLHDRGEQPDTDGDTQPRALGIHGHRTAAGEPDGLG